MKPHVDRCMYGWTPYAAGARQEITMKRMPTAALLLAALAAAGLAVALPVLAAVSNPRPEAEPGSRSWPAP